MLAPLGDLDDPPVSRSTRHQLLDIVVIALCAVICGSNTRAEVATFGRAKESWLRTVLELPGSIDWGLLAGSGEATIRTGTIGAADQSGVFGGGMMILE